MVSSLTNDFKSEFAMLLVIMKVNYGVTNALNYSKTLYEWTLAALITEGKVRLDCDKEGNRNIVDLMDGKNYANFLNFAKKKYREALDFTKTNPSPTLKSYAQHGILNACFEMDEVMFQIALSEGVLDLKDVTSKVISGMAGLNMQSEPE